MLSVKKKNVAIIGIVGLPAKYGGFETLVENLVEFGSSKFPDIKLTVYNSTSQKNKFEKVSVYKGAKMIYIPLKANGIQSIIYDGLSIMHAIFKGHDTLLILGVSGGMFIPIIRFFSSTNIITNIDGLEWKRSKWGPIAKRFLKFSEKLAIRFSHEVISDNQGVWNYVKENYSFDSKIISYGGDHIFKCSEINQLSINIPDKYALGLCRIEPENNVELILNAFINSDSNLVFVGNWNNSNYGRKLFAKFSQKNGFFLLDPIYDLGILKKIRERASLYVHGHSAGGTNPSLVEMMHIGVPIASFQCDYNYFTTSGEGLFFNDYKELNFILKNMHTIDGHLIGTKLKSVAIKNYMWDNIANSYFNLFIK
jgi:glycosyltransferase involved in cell wall biosynthesis